VTLKTGTIIIDNEFFNAIGNGYVPDVLAGLGILEGVHKLTLLLGVLAIVWFNISEVKSRKSKVVYNFEVMPMDMFILKLVFISALMVCITWVLAGYNGLSWTLVIMLAVVMIYDFMASQTVLGRHIYAGIPRRPN
jgi:putative multiple sugar transport system permease protein